MVNALVISNNINFIQALLNELNSNKLNIKISSIVTNYSNVMELMNSSDFRIVFVDSSVPKSNARTFFKTYDEIIVLLSYGSSAKLISPKNLKILNRLIVYNDLDMAQDAVIKELISLGYKRKYKGTVYLVDAITHLLLSRNKTPENLTTDVYPILANKYGKSAHSIKSTISKATDYMYCDCDVNFLQDYFGFYIDTKPTVKTVIFTVLSKL